MSYPYQGPPAGYPPAQQPGGPYPYPAPYGVGVSTIPTYPIAPPSYAQSFARDLANLKFNSRPIIVHLTTLAMQVRNAGDWEGMEVVGRELEEAIHRVRT
jgi:hypothetical protein